MNYDLCSGTCLKKSGIYSVAMFQKEKHRKAVLLFLVPAGFCGAKTGAASGL